VKMPSKTTLIRSGITVAVLVVAIVAGSLFAASKRPPVPATIQLNPQQQSKSDYDNALSALSNEATSTAIMLLERAVTIDPTNTAARTKLAALKKSTPEPKPSTPAPSPTTPTTTTPEPPKPDPNKPDPFAGNISLKKLLPSAMDGFSLGSPQIIAPDATLAGEPNASDTGAINVVWAVHDRGSGSSAQKFLDGVSKGLYPKDPAVVTVRGVTGYFGTDGTRFATVAFRRGRYVFEVLVTSSGPPADAKALAEKAAAAFPTAP
jgi:hypothetical protein